MASLIINLEFPPGSTFEDKSTRAGRIWFRTLRTIMQHSGCLERNQWGRWLDSPDKVEVIINWLLLDEDKPFLEKYVYCQPPSRFLKDLCSILVEAPVFNRTTLAREPLESHTTEVLSFYFPLTTPMAVPCPISKRLGLMSNAGSVIIDGVGWSTVPIHRAVWAWVEEEVEHKGQMAKAFLVHTDWRNAEAETSFKFESGRDFTKFFRAPGTTLEGLQYGDTATYEGFLKHLSPLGHERHYVTFKRFWKDDLMREKGCGDCTIQ
ncbi:MAG: hypothetical protein M1830_007141 [Pleopsidium flavum]|nr:MAG: hypothetical protein M1830_007141 [Pleopsidium flavum]